MNDLLTIIRKIYRWLSSHWLVSCVYCDRLLFEQNSYIVKHLNGAISPACKDCYYEHPNEPMSLHEKIHGRH
jgi:hypothetical protein